MLEIISNISSNLDQLNSDIDKAFNRAEATRNRLKKIALAQREHLMSYALLRENPKQILTDKLNKRSEISKKQR